jgi:thiol-activated cytolysin
MELIVLGGNAAVSSSAVSARNANDLVPIIEGENAVYSRNNPGVPISYTIRYLKDNSLAKLGYFTEYTATECSAVKTHDDIEIKLGQFKAIKDCDGIEGAGEFEFEIQILNKNGSKIASYAQGSITLNNGEAVTLNKTLTINMKREVGNKFTVRLICSEWDKDILQNTYRDSRMNKKTVSFTHQYNSDGKWSDEGGRLLTTNPGSDCSSEVNYRVTVR